MDESRKQFEAWFKSDYHPDKVGPYIKDILFFSWQASRSAIEITAPKFIDSREALTKGFTVDYSNGFGDAMDAYEENIRSAGVKVKE
ncbi:hypothetical protein [Escherichia coli]|uniref:hypothetical protein n=1 Tax=Escherichia coli TaxID=562 RepID=UPI0011CAA2CA|nr:hypothetical protein [Escherichia coli]EHE8729776.1 hypothetical protein [Escherichia coli]MBO9090040.1 hypothetical protein [Escherichia coli]TXQ86854.1 hypothetical protein FV303_00525 [Escherichia coli]